MNLSTREVSGELLQATWEAQIPGVPGQTYEGLFARYVSSDHGRHHADQPVRYANKYPYQRDQMLEDLGDDVHPVRHMSYTATEIVSPLLDYEIRNGHEPISTEDIVAIRIAAHFHDIGECEHPSLLDAVGKTVGDVAYGQKTDEDEATEAAIREHIYEELYPDLDPELLAKVEAIIQNADDSLRPAAFSTAEHIGYLLTGLRAGIKALELMATGETDSERFEQLRRLGGQVPLSHMARFMSFEQRFGYVNHVLDQNSTLLRNIERNLT